MGIKLEAGQWYRTRGGDIVYCIGNLILAGWLDRVWVQTEDVLVEEYVINGDYCTDDGSDVEEKNIVEHLPDCTGFDWELPKPKPKYRPFANRNETLSHCDGWWLDEAGAAFRVMRVESGGVTVYGCFMSFDVAFEILKRQDGTPFGVLDGV